MPYPTRTGRKAPASRMAQDERVGALLGDSRRRAPELEAVTRGEAAAAGVIALQGRPVSTAPTADEHNALLADVKAIAAVLNRLGAKFTGL